MAPRNCVFRAACSPLAGIDLTLSDISKILVSLGFAVEGDPRCA